MSLDKYLIILVHGIRDPAFWNKRLKELFETHADNVFVAPIKTDVVDVFRFISPTTGLRRKFVEDVRTKINGLVFSDQFKNRKKIIIAHSFGTYIVSKILDENTNIKIDKLIMCGNIVRNDFRWERIRKLNFRDHGDGVGTDHAIINDFSPNDIWPVLAEACAFGYGNGGSKGIGDPSSVFDRQHSIKHGDYLDTEFADKYWVPFIFYDLIIEEDTIESAEIKAPWHFIFTRIPINFMGLALCLFGVFVSMAATYQVLHTGHLFAAIEYESPEGPSVIVPTVSVTGYHVELPSKMDRPIYAHSPEWHADSASRAYLMRARSDNPVNQIQISVKNRPPFLCIDEEGEAPAPTEPTDWQRESTVYTVTFQPLTMVENLLGLNMDGETSFVFKYDPERKHETGVTTDFLQVKPKKGVDYNSVRVKVETQSDNCSDVDATLKPLLHEVVLPHATEQASLINVVGTAFANFLDSLNAPNDQNVGQHLTSADSEARKLGLEELGREPQNYDNLIRNIVQNFDGFSNDSIEDILRELPNIFLKAKFNTDNMESEFLEIFKLTWDERRKVRKLARRFLRFEGISSLKLANKLKEYWFQNKTDVDANRIVSNRYRVEYLAHLAIRDVYYNAGIYEFQNSREISSGPYTIDSGLKQAIEIFDSGSWLIENSPDNEKPSMSKNLYAKAYVMFRFARVKDATDGIYAKLEAGEIANLVLEGVNQDRDLPEDMSEASRAVKYFQEFLKHVDHEGAYYPWNHHLLQAQKCATGSKKLAYACINVS